VSPQQLAIEFKPLADSMAWKKAQITPQHITFDELKCAAYLGLVGASNQYDKDVGVHFSTFCRPRIFGAMQDYLRELDWSTRTIKVCKKPLEEMRTKTYTSEGPNEFFQKATRMLSLREKEMLWLHYWDGYTVQEVADKVDISISRAFAIFKACKEQMAESNTMFELAQELPN